jgi:uncharacterized membrane protein YphA (DoxX/SURF4 family)
MTMNVALWICQLLLAAVFAASGYAKATMSPERMAATGQTGPALFPLPVVRFTAVMELLAAIGLVLPELTGIAPALTGAAAIGLCLVMIGAASAHTRLHEPASVAVNVGIFALCVFVAVGRLVG